MATIRLKYVKTEVHGGKLYCYFRRRGFPTKALPGIPGSSEFMRAYEAALAGESIEIGASNTKPGTINALVASYYSTPAFTQLEASSQYANRSIIENHIRRPHGDKHVATLRRKHVIEMRDEIGATHPSAANNFLRMLRMLRMLMNHAVEKEWRTDNPVLGVKPVKYATDGHKTWSEEDIAKFVERHPIGTKAYLAMMLMLCTAGRISDAVAIGPQNIKNGKLTYTQYKNRKRNPVKLTIPLHPDLDAAIKATPMVGARTYLVNKYGRPFSPNSGSKWMRKRCDEAGLPEITSHGLRKACARRLAEAGRSAHHIKAITGHRTLKEVERYTQGVDQERMAEDAMEDRNQNVGMNRMW